MMKAVVQIIRGAFQDVWSDLWTVLVCNLLWSLANVLILPGPPATLALVYYTNCLAHGEVTDLSDFWKAFRRYWAPAWRWGAINLAVIGFLLGDIILTSQSTQGIWSHYLQGLYLSLLAIWLVLQFFALPFMYEQETMSVRTALRNGAALIGNNPGFTIALTVILLFILITGTITFMLSIAFGAVFITCTSNRAVLNRLEISKKARISIFKPGTENNISSNVS